MSDEITPKAIRWAARLAFRQFETLTDQEREAVLIVLVQYEEPPEAELAEKTLYHLREERSHQLLLTSILGKGDQP